MAKSGEEETPEIIEHPLTTSWTFWFDKKQPKKTDVVDYTANLKRLGNFNTVEAFWRQYVFLKRPSELDRDVNFYCFRDGALPLWESFPNGGCWILKLRKRTGVMGKMWQELLFAAIGEMFDTPDVVGVAMAIRSKEDLLSVWNAGNEGGDVHFHIGEKLKQILTLDPNTLLEYKPHNQSMADMSTFRNAKAYVFASA